MYPKKRIETNIESYVHRCVCLFGIFLNMSCVFHNYLGYIYIPGPTKGFVDGPRYGILLWHVPSRCLFHPLDSMLQDSQPRSERSDSDLGISRPASPPAEALQRSVLPTSFPAPRWW